MELVIDGWKVRGLLKQKHANEGVEFYKEHIKTKEKEEEVVGYIEVRDFKKNKYEKVKNKYNLLPLRELKVRWILKKKTSEKFKKNEIEKVFKD